MSGGCFDYKDEYLKHEIFGYDWDNKWRGNNVFEDREISEMIYDMFNLMHDYDWYISGDTGSEDYEKSKAKFRKKWLGTPRVRVQRTIDTALDELRQELYKTYGLETEE